MGDAAELVQHQVGGRGVQLLVLALALSGSGEEPTRQKGLHEDDDQDPEEDEEGHEGEVHQGDVVLDGVRVGVAVGHPGGQRERDQREESRERHRGRVGRSGQPGPIQHEGRAPLASERLERLDRTEGRAEDVDVAEGLAVGGAVRDERGPRPDVEVPVCILGVLELFEEDLYSSTERATHSKVTGTRRSQSRTT